LCAQAVDATEGRLFSDSIGAIFMETSALRGENILELHEAVARRLPVQETTNSDYAEMRGPRPSGKKDIRLTNKPEASGGSSGPCC
jgi:hypothetical protein